MSDLRGAAGWTVHSVHLRALYSAVLDRNLRSFVAHIAAACCPQAAEFANFTNPSQQQQHQQPPAAAEDLTSCVSSLLGTDTLERLPSLQVGLGPNPFLPILCFAPTPEFWHFPAALSAPK